MTRQSVIALLVVLVAACGKDAEEKTAIQTGDEAQKLAEEKGMVPTTPATRPGAAEQPVTTPGAPATGAAGRFATSGFAILLKAMVDDPTSAAALIRESEKGLRELGVISWKLTVENEDIIALLFVARTSDALKALATSEEVLRPILEKSGLKKSPPPILLQSEIALGEAGELPSATATLYVEFRGNDPGFDEAVAKDGAVRAAAGIAAYRVHRSLQMPDLRIVEYVARDTDTLRAYLKKSNLGNLPSAPKGRTGFTIGNDAISVGAGD